jgi:hypothetical protein
MYDQVCGIIEKASLNEVIKWVSLHFEMLPIRQSSSHMMHQVATHGGPLVRVSIYDNWDTVAPSGYRDSIYLIVVCGSCM